MKSEPLSLQVPWGLCGVYCSFTGLWNRQLRWCLWCISEHSLWAEREQGCGGPRSCDVPLGECSLSPRALQEIQVLFANCVYTAAVQSVDLVATGRSQGGKDTNVTGLELVRSVRGQTA